MDIPACVKAFLCRQKPSSPRGVVLHRKVCIMIGVFIKGRTLIFFLFIFTVVGLFTGLETFGRTVFSFICIIAIFIFVVFLLLFHILIIVITSINLPIFYFFVQRIIMRRELGKMRMHGSNVLFEVLVMERRILLGRLKIFTTRRTFCLVGGRRRRVEGLG